MEFFVRQNGPELGGPGPKEAHLPVLYNLLTMILVLSSLLLFRMVEKPRRRVAVWVLDLTRLILGYTSAEVLLLLFVMPFAARPQFRLDDDFGPRPPQRLHDIHNGPSQARNDAPEPPPLFIRHPFEMSRNMERDQQQSQFHASMLTMSALEIFPGMLFIYGLYMMTLYVGYRVKVFWNNNLSRFRLARDRRSGALVIHTSPPPGRDHAPAEGLLTEFLTESDMKAQIDQGFASGNYGAPVRVKWFVQQTLSLTLTVFIFRAIMISMWRIYSPQAMTLCTALFGWTSKIESVALRNILVGVLLPWIIYSIHFCLADYLFRYHPNGKGYKAFTTPFYADAESLSTGHEGDAENMVESYELTSMTPVTVSAEEYTAGSSDASYGTARPNNGTNSRAIRRSPTPSQIVSQAPVVEVSAPPTRSAPPEESIEEEIEAMVEDIRDFGEQALQKVKQIDRRQLNTAVNAGLQYGIVTASLLNAAAVQATSNARPMLFGIGSGGRRLGAPGFSQFNSASLYTGSSPSPSILASSTEDLHSRSSPVPSSVGIDGLDTDESDLDESSDDDDDEVDSDDERMLPSYTDSQRQHQQLLRDPVKARRHQHVLSEMKRA